MHTRLRTVAVLLSMAMYARATTASAQTDAPADAPPLVVISDEPKTIDPANYVPEPLAKLVTVDFSDASLTEVVAWLRDEQGIAVLVDGDALADVGLLMGDPVSDHLSEAPLYFLLNRLRSLGLAWYYDDDVLYITTEEAIEERQTNVPYQVGDLFDAGVEPDALIDVLVTAVEPLSWEEVGGQGTVSRLGDVMFVRQQDRVHREVEGLLEALRHHGRRTFALDPPQHTLMRQKLHEQASANFRNTPLKEAVAQLSEQTGVDIRLDARALDEVGIRERAPVSLSLDNRKLSTVLQAMVIDLDLTWALRDGVLWMTSVEDAKERTKTAVYDVRDLCRDDGESDALADAIVSQASPLGWEAVGGQNTISFAKAGVMVIGATDQVHDEVLELLESYRTALLSSKPRDRDLVDPNEATTVYYRLHANVARALARLLPQLVRPESWKSAGRPDAVGEILFVESAPDLEHVGAQSAGGSESDASAREIVVARAVLIVTQTRDAHDEIQKVIRRVEHGDASDPFPTGAGGGMGGMGGGIGGMGGGMGGGGFGGGMFSVPQAEPE